MAVAYAVAGQDVAAEALRQQLILAQHTTPFGDNFGLAAGSHDGISTGFGFLLFRRLHVGATAWNVFAQLRFNPYYTTTLSQEPQLTLTVNQTTFHKGDQLTLIALATPGLTPVTADVYIALQPSGCTSFTCIFFWQGGLNFTATPQPILRNWLISPFNGPIFTYTFGGTEPVDSYVWLGAFVVPGTGTLMGGITQAPFTFSP